MKKKILVAMTTLLALAFGASLAMASIQPVSTHPVNSSGIYSCCGWGWGGPYR